MQKDTRIRIFHLAKELNSDSKDLLDLCKQLKIDAANQISSLSPVDAVRLREAVRNRPTPTATATPPAKTTPPVAVLSSPELAWTQTLNALPNLIATKQVPPVVVVAPAMPAVPQSPTPKAPVLPRFLGPPKLSGPRPAPQPKPAAPPVPVSSPVAPVPVVAAVVTPAGSGIEQLLAVGAKAGLGKLDLIPKLAAIDTECAIFKVRQLAERLCRRLLGIKGERDLESMINEVRQRNLLSKKTVAYLRHIQSLGNQAAHNATDLFEDEFTIQDVHSAAAALACVLDAALKANLLGGS